MPHRSFEAGIEPGIVGAGLGCKKLHNFDRIAARACLVFGIVHFSDGRARQYQDTPDNQRDGTFPGAHPAPSMTKSLFSSEPRGRSARASLRTLFSPLLVALIDRCTWLACTGGRWES